VCFGRRQEGLLFTLLALPTAISKGKRFVVGERVAVAVEDASDDLSDWCAISSLPLGHSLIHPG
jgi:hypothetical protein